MPRRVKKDYDDAPLQLIIKHLILTVKNKLNGSPIIPTTPEVAAVFLVQKETSRLCRVTLKV